MMMTALQLGRALNKALKPELPISLDNEAGAKAEIEMYATEITPEAFGPKKLSVVAAKMLMDYPLTNESRKAAKALIKAASGVVKKTRTVKKSK